MMDTKRITEIRVWHEATVEQSTEAFVPDDWEYQALTAFNQYRQYCGELLDALDDAKTLKTAAQRLIDSLGTIRSTRHDGKSIFVATELVDWLEHAIKEQGE